MKGRQPDGPGGKVRANTEPQHLPNLESPQTVQRSGLVRKGEADSDSERQVDGAPTDSSEHCAPSETQASNWERSTEAEEEGDAGGDRRRRKKATRRHPHSAEVSAGGRAVAGIEPLRQHGPRDDQPVRLRLQWQRDDASRGAEGPSNDSRQVHLSTVQEGGNGTRREAERNGEAGRLRGTEAGSREREGLPGGTWDSSRRQTSDRTPHKSQPASIGHVTRFLAAPSEQEPPDPVASPSSWPTEPPVLQAGSYARVHVHPRRFPRWALGVILKLVHLLTVLCFAEWCPSFKRTTSAQWIRPPGVSTFLRVPFSWPLCRCYSVNWRERILAETEDYLVLDKPHGVPVSMALAPGPGDALGPSRWGAILPG